jgi:outer membrane lipoprotein-sorting protein
MVLFKRCSLGVSVFFMFFLPFTLHAITKTELLEQAEKQAVPFKYGISARFTSKASVQSKTITDSGTIYLSPPNKSRVDFLVSKVVVSSCGDTTWTKTATGDVTRSLSSNVGLQGGQGAASSMSSPDLLSYLKKGDFTIVREDSAAVVVSMSIANGNQKIPFTFYIDPKAFVLKRIEFPSPMAGMFQLGYRYKLFDGHLVVDEVNTVMGSLGFSRVQLFDYRKNKQKSSFFRIF